MNRAPESIPERRAGRARPLRSGVMLLALSALATLASAQTAPSAEPDAKAMIEALKPPVTRAVRNFQVRPVAASAASAPMAAPPGASQAAPAAAPSLSLAIQFDFDSARIRAQSWPVLMQLALAMRSPELSASRFLIEGHTDAKGAAAYNLRLSQLRADEVQRFLVTQGVPPSRLTSVGRGSTQPLTPADPTGPENRRVRVVNVE